MNSVAHLNLADKGTRAYRRAMLKDPELPPLVKGAGRVTANGKLRVLLPLVDRTVAVYSAVPRTEWRFHLETRFARPKAAPAPSPSELIKRSVDEVLTVLADIERCALAAEQASNITPIAAE